VVAREPVTGTALVKQLTSWAGSDPDTLERTHHS
jgi:hypothetical protein